MAKRNWRVGILAVLASAVMAGCLPEAEESATPAPAEEEPNTPPTISGTPSPNATAGISWQFQPSASDAQGDPLVFSASGLPGWAAINPQTGRVSGTPSQGDVGTTASIVVSVTDGRATASLAPFSIVVASATPPPPPPPPANTRPAISGTPATTVQATSAYSFTPSATDAETPQALTYSILNRPVWASFSTTTGTLSGTPSPSQVGAYSNIVISVSDGALAAALPAFTLTVTAAPNRPPVISGSPAQTATVGTAYSFRATASDPDGQALTWQISNKPAWISFNANNGQLSGTPSSQHVGTTSGIVITVSDGTASASLPAFSITVEALPNRPPTISGTPPTTITAGSNYRFAPTASDADGDSLTWSISGKPGPATFSTATGVLTWTPTAAGSWTNIVITVTDSRGASASLPAFSITVTAPPQNGSAALSWTAPAQYTDGSSLPGSALTAFQIYRGTSAGNLTRIAEVDGNTTTFTVSELPSGTHYFAVTAVTEAGESALSAVGSKTIP